MLRIFRLFLICFALTACASLKKDKNKLVGAGSEDISSQDIDSDGRGSDSGDISGLNTVYFEYDSAGLSEEAKAVLMSNLQWIKDQSSVKTVELEGHCDAMGSESYNIGLGRRRAEAVKSFLQEQGIESNRLSVISYGEERPFSEVDYAKNRRVNFVPMY